MDLRLFMKHFLRRVILFAHFACDVRAQERTFADCAIGVIVGKNETIIGSGFVAFAKAVL